MDRQFLIGGRRSGRSFAIAQVCKTFPKSGVIVPNLKVMDNMIGLGVQPSQIIMPSELKKPQSAADYLDSIYPYPREDIEDGGSPCA